MANVVSLNKTKNKSVISKNFNENSTIYVQNSHPYIAQIAEIEISALNKSVEINCKILIEFHSEEEIVMKMLVAEYDTKEIKKKIIN